MILAKRRNFWQSELTLLLSADYNKMANIEPYAARGISALIVSQGTNIF